MSSNSSTASVNRPAAISLAPQVIQALNDKPPFCHIKREIIGHHRTIASASLRRLFAPLLPFEKPEIHTGFETVEKGLCPFLTKGLQSAARTICTPLAYKSHTCSLSCIFCQVHAPTENDQNPFAACGRQTLRGFFDTLKYIQDSFVFQTLNWDKNPV